MAQPIWDDEHKGPRWRYGLQNRPVGYGTVPEGWLIQSDRTHFNFAHGTIDYPRPLTDDEARGYELVHITTLEGQR